MIHTIIVNASRFSQAVKDATFYTRKESSTTEAMSHVLLTCLPTEKRLAVIGCDEHGYYERRLALYHGENDPMPSLPGERQRLCISAKDAAMLVKFLDVRSIGCVTLQVDDERKVNGNYLVTLMIPDVASTFFCTPADLEVPEYSGFVNKAEAGKEHEPELCNVNMPVHEMIRAGKVFPKKSGSVVRVFTSPGYHGGHMALLEYQDACEDVDIRVIFMFARDEAEAA